MKQYYNWIQRKVQQSKHILFKFDKINRTNGTGVLLTLCHNAYMSSFSRFKFLLKTCQLEHKTWKWFKVRQLTEA